MEDKDIKKLRNNPQDFDFDWFFKAGDKYNHVASSGGIIPNKVIDKLAENNYNRLCEVIRELPSDFDVEIDEDYIKKNILKNSSNPLNLEMYIFTFRAMARKGFYSYDRIHLGDKEDNTYHLVAWPNRSNNIDRMKDLDDFLIIVDKELDNDDLVQFIDGDMY